jgi:hypothetical protein
MCFFFVILLLLCVLHCEEWTAQDKQQEAHTAARSGVARKRKGHLERLLNLDEISSRCVSS